MCAASLMVAVVSLLQPTVTPAKPTRYILVSTLPSLAFSWQIGTTSPAAQVIKIWDTSPNHVPFTVSTDQPWLQASPTSATTATNITISVSPSSLLTAGIYWGNVLITASALANSPMRVPVTISVTAAPPPTPSSASLSWNPSTSVVVGYNVYRGTQSGGPYTKLNSSPVSATTCTDSSVKAGQTYFYVVTAADSSNVESAYSNEVSASIPSP
jgi:hypothetical protein